MRGFRFEGHVRYRGRNIYDAAVNPVAVRRFIGMVFQQPNPFANSIYKNVASGLRLSGYRGGMAEKVEKALRPKGKVTMHIVLPMALPAIVTGILLAFAISVGETAPLLYTAGWSNYLWNGHLTNEPIGYLTYAIWAFITKPFASAHALAYAAAWLVTFFVLIISIISRSVLHEGAVSRHGH